MTITQFVDHLVFRISELDRTERFYTAILGHTPERAEGSLMYRVGETRLFFTSVTESRQERYEKEKVGLNHIAFGVRTLKELQAVETQLNEKQILHSGLQVDRYGQKEFIWIDDPDGMRVEFYLRS